LPWVISTALATLRAKVYGLLEQLWMEADLEVEGRWWISAALQHIEETEQPSLTAAANCL
jgi:hypothetical protein